MGKALVVGVQGKARTPGWVKQRENWPYAHSQHLPLYSWGNLEGFLAGGVPHSPTCLHSVSIHVRDRLAQLAGASCLVGIQLESWKGVRELNPRM